MIHVAHRSPDDAVLNWLLKPEQPAMRFLASRHLVTPRPSQQTLERLRSEIPRRSWAARILAKQREKTWWTTKKNGYLPYFGATIWHLQVLADLGMTKTDERIVNAADFWLGLHYAKDGGYAPRIRPKRGHLCTTGNMVRSLVRFGYLKDERVQSAIRWLVDQQLPDGGWDCFGRRRGTIDAWEAMSAFAEIPEQSRTSNVREAIRKGGEFFLKRRLLHEGRPSKRWMSLHYPWHFFYDVLAGLDFTTALGYGNDHRTSEAFSVLLSKRRPDGRWASEGNNWYPLPLEKPGAPSKMITFLALRVLKRWAKQSSERNC